jgi:peptide methionine sulfoxide reductase MsrB
VERWAVITLTLYDVETGYLRDVETAEQWDGALDYQWTEGNYACDCNRSLFLLGHKVESQCGDNRFHLTVSGPGAPRGSL